MIRAEDERVLLQTVEGIRDVPVGKLGTIPPHRDDFLVAERAQRLDRILEALGKMAAALRVAGLPGAGGAAGTEDVDVGRRIVSRIRQRDERKSGEWEAAAGQIEARRVGEDEQGAPRHEGMTHLCAAYSQSVLGPIGSGLLRG